MNRNIRLVKKQTLMPPPLRKKNTIKHCPIMNTRLHAYSMKGRKRAKSESHAMFH